MPVPSPPEVWLRGPIPGVPALLMPVVHSLLQIREELEAVVPQLSPEDVWAKPGGAAPVGFHLRHLAGSLDRLLTYARGQALDERQRAALDAEEAADAPRESPAALLRLARNAIERAIDQVRTTSPGSLGDSRAVGRSALPSTVLGLLFHAAEHAQRHAGQIVTTARVVRPSTR